MEKRGRLMEGSRYHPGDFQRSLGHQMEAAQLTGDRHTVSYLHETFGVRPISDEDFKAIVDRIRRMDPNGVGSHLVLLAVQAEEKKDRGEIRRLTRLYKQYLELPEESRASSIAVKDILCQALHKRSYFDYPRGRSPVEKFFGDR